jgi:hypothetical protein
MTVEVIEFGGIRYAEVLRASLIVSKTEFFSPAESSFQFGIISHKAGYREAPHFHSSVLRTIDTVQQMFVVQQGIIDVEFFDGERRRIGVVRLSKGDSISLVSGGHAISVIEDAQCVTVKQGPFLGDALDKIDL